MDSPRMAAEELTPFSPPDPVLDPGPPTPIPWDEARTFLLEIEDHLRLLPENAPDSEARLRLLVERIPALFEVLRQAHAVLDQRVEAQTTELLEANTLLRRQLKERARAERRLTAEHAVSRILAASTRLRDAAPRILETIAESLGWDVGVLWTLDRDAEVLRCIEVWHTATVEIVAFEQASRQHPCSAGIGLPGRVWASGAPCWIPDLTREGNFPRRLSAAVEGLHAAVGFPIHNGVEFLGVLEFFSRKIRQPEEELLRTMTSIGSHISQFIERMKAEEGLYQREVQLGVARKIQQGLIPKAWPALAGFDIAGVSHCAAETGGDFFDFFPLPGSCQGIVIADASGHGIGPALLATETHAYLRALSLTHADIDRIAVLVNRRLGEAIGEDYFVTLLLARLDPGTRSLFYTSAGHTTGFLLNPAGHVKTVLRSTGFPLGLFPDDNFPIAGALALEPGDLVLLLTDGVVEACSPDDTAFGFQRAIDIVRVYRQATAAQIVDNLYHAVRAFSHNLPQIDDITVVVVKAREVA